MKLPLVLTRCFFVADFEPSYSLKDNEQLHRLTENFIKNPNFNELSFTSQRQWLSYREIHTLTFVSKHDVRWRTKTIYSLGIISTEEWIGTYTIDSVNRVLRFKFNTSKWFHQVPFHYYDEPILRRGSERMISLMADCDEYLKLSGPCDKDGKPNVQNLIDRRLSGINNQKEMKFIYPILKSFIASIGMRIKG